MHTKFSTKKKLTGIQHFDTLDMNNRIILQLILNICRQKFIEIIELFKIKFVCHIKKTAFQ